MDCVNRNEAEAKKFNTHLLSKPGEVTVRSREMGHLLLLYKIPPFLTTLLGIFSPLPGAGQLQAP